MLPGEQDITLWHCVIDGPDSTPYTNGAWTLAISFPEDYPLRAPEIRFVTPICESSVLAAALLPPCCRLAAALLLPCCCLAAALLRVFPHTVARSAADSSAVHCNVNAHGKICHSIFDRNYSSDTTVGTLLEHVYGLLLTPDKHDPLDSTLAL